MVLLIRGESSVNLSISRGVVTYMLSEDRVPHRANGYHNAGHSRQASEGHMMMGDEA